MGGFAHLATLVKRVKDSRPNALLPNGGDSWQGSATALWTAGQDMVEASLEPGVEVMTGHWEFTHGAERVLHVVDADLAMQATIDRVRAPFAQRLQEPIAESQELLYRRGNFSGSWDQLIVEALLHVKDAEIAFSPGFRWGPTLLPGQTITRERLLEQTAITYPDTSVVPMTGVEIKHHLEKLCDKIFNADPYQQQGGDMVRTGGLAYACEPAAEVGSRISDMRLNGKPIQADKSYKVARWGVGSAQSEGEPVWDVVEQHLKSSQAAL